MSNRWQELLEKHGLDDKYADVRRVWSEMTNAERIFIIKAANLSSETRLVDVLSDNNALAIKNAIIRASKWGSRLAERINVSTKPDAVRIVESVAESISSGDKEYALHLLNQLKKMVA